MASERSRTCGWQRGTVWWLVLTGLFLSAAVVAVHDSRTLVAGLQTEVLVALEDVQRAFESEDMPLAERAAMRLWRLAELQADSYLAASTGRELSRLALAVTDAASGWRAVSPGAGEMRQVAAQLINLRQMILTGDYSQANSIVVWLERR